MEATMTTTMMMARKARALIDAVEARWAAWETAATREEYAEAARQARCRLAEFIIDTMPAGEHRDELFAGIRGPLAGRVEREVLTVARKLAA